MAGRKKTLLLDFDGVLHDYHGWQGEGPEFLGPPIEKARHACLILEREFKLVCFTTRPRAIAEPWLRRNGFPEMLVTNVKIPAFLLVDDRGLTFTGEWSDEFINAIRNFQPHWASAAPHTPGPGTAP